MFGSKRRYTAKEDFTLSEAFAAGVWGRYQQTPHWVAWNHQNLSDNHCAVCLKLDDCWFEKGKAPPWPHHPFCQCVLEPISYNEVLAKSSANSAYSKFDPYLFDTKGDYGHCKDLLFKSWGYTVEDSAYLKEQIEKQGLEKYIAGDYTLGKLNDRGQRISIVIELERKDNKNMVKFTSGWLVYPNGRIQLTTPYGGK